MVTRRPLPRVHALVACAGLLAACSAQYAETAAMAGTGGGGTSSGGAGAGGVTPGGSSGTGGTTEPCAEVTTVPEAVRTRLMLDPFYEKHVDARGIPILASSAPADESLLIACRLLENMLSRRDDIRQELIRNGARFAVIGRNEDTSDIPEYGYRDRPQAEIDELNRETRGLAGIAPACGEENLLCLAGDRYVRESICVHNFSHTITTYGAYTVEPGFEEALTSAYDGAFASGILDDTFRASNAQEYWAEGVQDWYDTNDWAAQPNGIHNEVNTRAELAEYDPALYALIAEIFPEDTAWGDCKLE
ncbi:MAG TPA: hypothetical protein VGK73_07130 [Polyangiaceae bacterium]